ncbi:MAG: sulfite exporter TauE/SafE family protein [Luteolibacter sp.]|jgi:sulfite exporter TauE/SafE|nr:sulfite exporter TauE/SafE family protein [Luteolibacter sp.]
MTTDITILTFNAMAVAFIHTVIGPDHYVPFIVMSKARNWSFMRTAMITLACGIGHVASSVILGMAGFAVGASLRHLEWIESFRGGIAAWALIIFGALYAAWGLWRLKRKGPDGHSHDHLIRLHSHDHIHDPKTGAEISLTPWILFAIFVFGPCEPLIPLFIYPAATSGWAGAWLVSAAFAVVTVASMMVLVLAARFGLEWLPARRLARYNHVFAGGTIAIAGLMIQFLGL